MLSTNVVKSPLEEYRLLEVIGVGSFGKVYKALKARTQDIVAIKIIELDNCDEDIQDIQKEIAVLAQCDSPWVTRYYESYIHHTKLYIVMEYLGAGSCLDLLHTGPFDERTIAVILREVLKGLHYLHSQGMMHRDVKAANILLSLDGRVKLGDFGVAAQYVSDAVKRKTFVGTPFWMAPEVIKKSGYDYMVNRLDDPKYYLFNDIKIGGYLVFRNNQFAHKKGITAIELAKGAPPLSEFHPMKALFMIPEAPPPTLEDQDGKPPKIEAKSPLNPKPPQHSRARNSFLYSISATLQAVRGDGNTPGFSKNFKDFVAKCLVMDPTLRPCAKELLKHRFIRNAPKRMSYLHDIQERYTAWKTTKAMQEEFAFRQTIKSQVGQGNKTITSLWNFHDTIHPHNVAMYQATVSGLRKTVYTGEEETCEDSELSKVCLHGTLKIGGVLVDPQTMDRLFSDKGISSPDEKLQPDKSFAGKLQTSINLNDSQDSLSTMLSKEEGSPNSSISRSTSRNLSLSPSQESIHKDNKQEGETCPSTSPPVTSNSCQILRTILGNFGNDILTMEGWLDSSDKQQEFQTIIKQLRYQLKKMDQLHPLLVVHLFERLKVHHREDIAKVKIDKNEVVTEENDDKNMKGKSLPVSSLLVSHEEVLSAEITIKKAEEEETPLKSFPRNSSDLRGSEEAPFLVNNSAELMLGPWREQFSSQLNLKTLTETH